MYVYTAHKAVPLLALAAVSLVKQWAGWFSSFLLDLLIVA